MRCSRSHQQHLPVRGGPSKLAVPADIDSSAAQRDANCFRKVEVLENIFFSPMFKFYGAAYH